MALVSAAALVTPVAQARSVATVIRLLSLTSSTRAHRAVAQRATVGDWIAENDRLLNPVRQFGKPSGAIVGSDQATFTNQGKGMVTVSGTAQLPGGTLLFRGRVTTKRDGTQVAPVVAGTGRFAGAQGTLTIRLINTRLALNVYRLLLPPAI